MSTSNRLDRYFVARWNSRDPDAFPWVFVSALSLDVDDETWDAALAFVAKELGTEGGES